MSSLFEDDLPVIRVALPVPLRRCFDYVLPPRLQNHYLPLGARVRVPYRNKELVGVIMQRQVTPDVEPEKLRPVSDLLDDGALLSDDQLRLANWLARYFHAPIGEVISLMLPPLLRQGGGAHIQEEAYWQLTLSGRQLDPADMKRATKQAALLAELQQHGKPVAASVLRALGFTQSQMTALEDKGLANYEMQARQAPEIAEGKKRSVLSEVSLVLNEQQQRAVSHVTSLMGQSRTCLLEGVTGSGKTEVYLQIVEAVLKQGLQVLILVPEIGLAPQTVERFRKRFSVPVLTFHSGLNDKERLDAWLLSRNGRAGVLIGTRSAVLTPFKDLGLVIVDEEHDASYKQGDGVRYSARDAAVVRGSMLSVPVLLGSATPSLESRHNAREGRYDWLKLTERAGAASDLPEIYLHDIKTRRMQSGLDAGLIPVIRSHLEQGGQVLVFINRRGFSPALMCHECGWIAQCDQCDARMTLHKEPPRLHCHHCDTVQPIPTSCPNCFHEELKPVGTGTERTEAILEQAFSDWPVYRIDRDSVSRKGAMEKVLSRIHTGEPCLLVGTQMLAKGHHFPEVSLVVVLDADGGFYSADFRGLERMGQLLTQVAGRAGRALRKGKVVVQTHHPADDLLQLLAEHDYAEFSEQLLAQREEGLLPPYTFMALLRAEAHRVQDVEGFLQNVLAAVNSWLQQPDINLSGDVEVIGPLPAPMERRNGRYHMQLWLQSPRRAVLHAWLDLLIQAIEREPLSRKVRWSLDVDPQEML